MKRIILTLLIVALLCAIPFLMPRKAADDTPISPTESVAVETQTPVSFDAAVTLRVLSSGSVVEMTLRDYLVGVMAAEISPDFPGEALKAQAVASRTFALRKAGEKKHADADVCTDPACCQGWNSDADPVFTAVVEATDGLVVTYDDALIDATFFSCSGGKTEAAQAVWGSDIPYLQSVDSPGEESAPRFSDCVTLDSSYFSQILEEIYPEINLSGAPAGWFGSVSQTSGGGIDTIFIGGVPVPGTKLRSLFSLRSTDISVSCSGNEITLTTHGFGHRVGLSQYGAKAMAEAGADFATILTHYYSGSEIKKLLCATTEQPFCVS